MGVRRPTYSLSAGSPTLPRRPGARSRTGGPPVPRGVRCPSMGATRLKRCAGGMRGSARTTLVPARVSYLRCSQTDYTIRSTRSSPSPSRPPISNPRSLPSPLLLNPPNPSRQNGTGRRIVGPPCTRHPRRLLLLPVPQLRKMYIRPYRIRTRIMQEA
jgi:hypothetical protein